MRKRLIARYAVEEQESFEIVTRYETETESLRIDKSDPSIESIAAIHPSAIWFERKIADDFGIRFENAFDRRPLLHHERFPRGVHPMRKAFESSTQLSYAPYLPYPYEVVSGESVFEVSVGPIHAGIIEPGHFHFSQAGEEILHQEVRHFYKYRGIEKMLEGRTPLEAKAMIERISGNASIAYQIAWAKIVSEASGVEIPRSLASYHALLLEMERIVHHLTDLGFIPNDAGFAAALSYASQRTEEARRMLAGLCGHRFGFGAVDFSVPSLEKSALLDWIERLEEQMRCFEAWIVDIPSLWDRFDGTGVLPTKKAIKYDTVGVVARASGLRHDVRQNEALYEEAGFALVRQKSADVSARFKVRLEELFESLKMMRFFLKESETTQPMLPPWLEDGRYEAFVESSLGELFMTMDLEQGKIVRFFVRDPSFVNWQALHLMMPDNIIADFPLINKSCDLSYAGNDL